MSKESWAKTLREMTAEYIERFQADGPICAEFAGRPGDFDHEVFREVSERLYAVNSRWVVHPCEVCVEHHGPTHPFHWEINLIDS